MNTKMIVAVMVVMGLIGGAGMYDAMYDSTVLADVGLYAFAVLGGAFVLITKMNMK